jgi:hypothetical protein
MALCAPVIDLLLALVGTDRILALICSRAAAK